MLASSTAADETGLTDDGSLYESLDELRLDL